MTNSDIFFRQLRQKHRSQEEINWTEARNTLAGLVISDMEFSQRKHIYLKIKKYFGRNKDIKILDFGCGSGESILYLYMLGYKNVYGIDIISQIENIDFTKKMGINKALFFEYDKKSIPFKDESFDIVISEQVLEHVFDIDNYYCEAFRVLKKGGLAYFNFPHRLIPYDSHSRTWLIHFFPKSIRRYLFRIIKKDPDYYDNILNFKTISYHKKKALQSFSRISIETKERLLSFNNQDLERYEGNVFIRSTVDKMIKSRISGNFLLPIFSKMSNVDFCLFK